MVSAYAKEVQEYGSSTLMHSRYILRSSRYYNYTILVVSVPARSPSYKSGSVTTILNNGKGKEDMRPVTACLASK